MSVEAIAKIRAEAASHFNGDKGFDNTARRNAYVCEDNQFSGRNGCGHFIVTVDREPGVTPAMVTCGHCGNFAGSKFYRIADWMEPTHEWYRPETLGECKPGERDHVERGGLLLRKIDGGSSKEGWQAQEKSRRIASIADFPLADFAKARAVSELSEKLAIAEVEAKFLADQGRPVKPHGSGGGISARRAAAMEDEFVSLGASRTGKTITREPACEVTGINRADYPNRQQYRAACRQAVRGGRNG